MIVKWFTGTIHDYGAIMDKTIPELIVKYIKDNPGCIKAMYYPQDRDGIKEEFLLNPDDWIMTNCDGDPITSPEPGEDQWWENNNERIIIGYWRNEVWVECQGWCGGIVALIDGDQEEKDERCRGQHKLDNGLRFNFQEN